MESGVFRGNSNDSNMGQVVKVFTYLNSYWIGSTFGKGMHNSQKMPSCDFSCSENLCFPTKNELVLFSVGL